jgi:flagellar hook protein FlgE
MLGSMYSAVSGLSAHQKKMDVIGNNIANVNTYGFKSSRVSFSDVFYQTLNGALAPKQNSGGTNPNQLGYGVKVSSIDVINTRAGSATTDRALDVYINGDGYLPVKDNNGIIKYTRVGILNFDTEGNLVDANGNMVLGLRSDGTTKLPQMDSDGTTGIQNLEPIKVATSELEKLTGISIGQNGEITAIKEGDPMVTKAPNTGWLTDATLPPTSVYNGQVTITDATESNTVNFIQGKYPDGSDFATGGTYTVESDADIKGPLSISYNGTEVILSYFKKDGTSDTRSAVWDGTTSSTLNFAIDDTSDPVGTANIEIQVSNDKDNGIILPTDSGKLVIGNVIPDNITLTLSTFDKSGAPVTATGTLDMSGNPPGNTLVAGELSLTVDPVKFGTMDLSTLKDLAIGTAGPGPGNPEKIANMAIVNFINPDGLSQIGEGYSIETTNSGDPVATMPGNQGTGSFRSGALEMSNVDLSREFTEMIIAQRGFQANTRMITVSDEMLSELVNMKR